MYARWGQNRGYRVAFVGESPLGRYGQINSVILQIDGRYACGYLKSETGMHRLQRTSPLNITGKLQTTATVEVVPINVELEIPQQDLEIILPPRDVISGKVPTWVRMVHVPTGIYALSTEKRSLLLNREMALALLKSKLFATMQRQEVAEISDQEQTVCYYAKAGSCRNFRHSGRDPKNSPQPTNSGISISQRQRFPRKSSGSPYRHPNNSSRPGVRRQT